MAVAPSAATPVRNPPSRGQSNDRNWKLAAIDPAALLVAHPCLPIPELTRTEVRIGRGGGVPMERLSRQQRLVWASQLTALTGLLADFELWPGLWALRQSWIEETDDGLCARLPTIPRPLARVSRRLGGGERAALRLRDAVTAVINGLTGAALSSGGATDDAPGFFLDPLLNRLLGGLNGCNADRISGFLWAARLSLPPLPHCGEICYWSVPDDEWAHRIGLASVVAARQRGLEANLQATGGDHVETAPQAQVGSHGMLVLTGRPQGDDLAVLDRWVAEGDRSAVVCGRFPRGWDPPVVSGFDAESIHQHVAVTGVSREMGRGVLDRRNGRFDLFSAADRRALAGAIAEAVPGITSPSLEQLPGGGGDAVLRSVLELLPDGLPEGFVAVHTGLRPRQLERSAATVGAVLDNGRWRLADPPSLGRHPLHAEVAALFDRDDPRRLRHEVLAGADPARLERWLRNRLDELAVSKVRELLADVHPGELGEQAQCAMVEACLADCDLSAARTAMAALPDVLRRPFEGWMSALDATPRPQRGIGGMAMTPHTCRAVAELALVQLRRTVRSGGDRRAAQRAVEEVVGGLTGRLHSAMAVRLALIIDAQSFEDPALRRRMHRSDPVVRRVLWRYWARYLHDSGRSRSARRLLCELARRQDSPGSLGLLRFDLAGVEADLGRFAVSDRLNLGAHRLLQAAGFRRRTRDVLFNIAVSDIDRLQVDRARHRLELLDGDGSDPMVVAEQARMFLAVGDKKAFEAQYEKLRSTVGEGNPRLAPAVSFLAGARALLAGDRNEAETHLARGDAEGQAWLCLRRGLVGRLPSPTPPRDDWGIVQAAVTAASVVNGCWDEEALGPVSQITVQDAFGLAVLEKTMGRQRWLSRERRVAASRRLEDAGIDGWARFLRGVEHADNALMRALAELSECGRVELLTPTVRDSLVDCLGLSGLELRSAATGRVLHRDGSGPAGAAVQCGHLFFVPLGGEVGEESHWRLFLNLLQRMTPDEGDGGADAAEPTGLYGQSPATLELRGEIRRYAPSQLAVVFLGETGVGKEVAARALHRESGRLGPFMAVNVAGIPEGLLESDLFGSVKGAFTGADRSRVGLVDKADGGTLFLDEIGDLGLPLQVKLLRFLESQEVRPVGADSCHTVDVRIVSATHRNLQERVLNGSFREDLYYRIAGATIRIPPLRERKQDIPLLRSFFAKRFCEASGRPMSAWSRDAEEALISHPWPGNVRELINVVEGALLRANGGDVTREDLGLDAAKSKLPTGTWDEAMADFRRRFLLEALERNNQNRSATARELGISRQALLYHIRKLDVGH